MKLRDFIDIFRLPRATVNLMLEQTTDNDPFYAKVVKAQYDEANSRHPKMLFARKYEYGYTLCELPKTFDDYFMKIEASARRNYKKALRLGYKTKRMDFNKHLEDVRDIWVSTPVRQRRLMPQDIREGQVRPVTDPPSKTTYHDYPYYGVFKDEKVLAYAACLIAGELCEVQNIYGHVQYQNDGLVPMLFIDIARELLNSFPAVKYYSYGTFYGAGETMRRFKQKFLFDPYHVTWKLSSM